MSTSRGAARAVSRRRQSTDLDGNLDCEPRTRRLKQSGMTSTQASRSTRWPARLFATSGLVFAISLFSPAVQSISTHVMRGYEVFLWTIWHTFFPWMWIELLGSGDYLSIQVPMWLTLAMGTFANVTLIMSAATGWFLRRRAPVMCSLAACGLLAGLMMPIVGVAGGWADGNLRDIYKALYFGYWLWIASLAPVTAAWGSVVWDQTQSKQPGRLVVCRH